MKQRPTAGLPLSVGSATRPVRILVAAVFLMIGLLCIAAGLIIDRTGSAAATVLAIVAVVPLGWIACLAAAFAIAPFSRFGVWLDAFVGSLTAVRALVAFAVLWGMAAMVIFGVRVSGW